LRWEVHKLLRSTEGGSGGNTSRLEEVRMRRYIEYTAYVFYHELDRIDIICLGYFHYKCLMSFSILPATGELSLRCRGVRLRLVVLGMWYWNRCCHPILRREGRSGGDRSEVSS